MIDLKILESKYQYYMHELSSCLPDGMVYITRELAQSYGINPDDADSPPSSEQPYCYFYVMESPEKITLTNEEFVVWLVPVLENNEPATYALIALNENNQPKLEMAFCATGPFNHPNLVLRLLEACLYEVKETETLIHHLDE